MAVLVADVGGTNSRFALSDQTGVIESSIRRLANNQFGSFYDAADTFLASVSVDAIEASCVAVAGHVSGGRVKLTNIDWQISEEGLRQHLSCKNALLLNDLTALGYSIDALGKTSLTQISNAAGLDQENSQSLVIGIGTGFNVCPVKRLSDDRLVCLEVEYGHSKLPGSIRAEIGASSDPKNNSFRTVEDLFSGEGLSRFHGLLAGVPAKPVPELVEMHKTDPSVEAALQQFARVLGMLTSELILKYLPMDGIYFAGGIARVLFDHGTIPAFCEAIRNYADFEIEVHKIPISVVNDDFAPLRGCYTALQEM